MAQVSATECDICKEDIGKVFCYECRHFLCKSCNSWHEKFPATKRHTITDSHSVDRSTLMLKLVCTDHNLQFAYYCRDSGCLICAQCVTSLHKGHSITDIVDIAAESREVVKKRLSTIQINIENLENLIEAFKTTKQTKLQTDTDNFIKEINEISQDLTNIIETVTEINLTQVSDCHALEKHLLLYSLAKLEKSYCEYKSLHERCKQVLKEKHDVSFFLIQESLIKEFELLDDIPLLEEPKEITHFKRDDFVDLIVNAMEDRYNRGQQTVSTMDKQVEGLQGENEKKIKYLEYKTHVLEQKLKKEQKDAIINVNNENEKQLVIDHYTKQVQSRDNQIQSIKSELERKESTLQTVLKQRDKEQRLKEEERKQKEEACMRLSAIAGDNDPGITDQLGDPNRPMKIAEKFTEMYDNDWTDSMEALEDLDLGEEECVKILLHFLTDSYEECGRLVAELDSHILKGVTISTCEQDINEYGDNNLQGQKFPGELLKPVKDLRKKMTENNVAKLQKKLPAYLMKTQNITEEHITACSKFVADCIKYAWMMQIQDPPVYIEGDFPSDTKIDTDILRSYTKAGDRVDFIVWPVLYLHKGGPVLYKGVVQPKSGN